jgi:WD40 repeat protein
LGLSSGGIVLVDTATGVRAGSFPTGKAPHHLAFIDKGRSLLSAEGKKGAAIYDRKTGKVVEKIATGSAVLSASASSNGKLMALATKRGDVEIYHRRSGVLQRKLSEDEAGGGAHDGPAIFVSFLGSNRIVSADSKGLVKLWDLGSSPTLQRKKRVDEGLASLWIDPTGRRLVLGGKDGLARVWSLPSLSEVSTSHLFSHPTTSALLLAGKRPPLLVAGSMQGGVLSVGPRLHTKKRAHPHPTATGAPVHLAATADQRDVLVADGDRLRLYRRGDAHRWTALPAWRSTSKPAQPRASITKVGHRLRLHAHSLAIQSFDVDPKSTHLASISKEGRLVIWSLPTGRIAAEATTRPGEVVEAAFDSRGRSFVAVSRTGSVRRWSLGRKAALERAVRTRSGRVSCADVDRTATKVALGLDSARVEIWDLAKEKKTKTLRYASPPTAVAFDRTGRWLEVITSSGKMKRSPLGSSSPAHSPSSSQAGISPGSKAPHEGSSTIHGSGCGFAKGGDRGRTVVSWGRFQGTLRTVELAGRSPDTLAVGPEGRFAALAHPAGGVYLLSHTKKLFLVSSSKARVSALSFSHDRSYLFAGRRDGSIEAIALQPTKSRSSPLRPASWPRTPPHPSSRASLRRRPVFGGRVTMVPSKRSILGASISHRGRMAAATSDGTLLVGDGLSRRVTAKRAAHRSGATWVSHCAGGELLLSGGRGGILRMWESETLRPVWTVPGHLGGVWEARCDPSGRLAATAGEDGSVRAWQASTGRPVETLLPPTKPKPSTKIDSSRAINTVAFHPTRPLVAAGGVAGRVDVWKTGTWQRVTRLKASSSVIMTMSFIEASGQLAVGDSSGRISRIDTSDWKVIGSFAAGGFVRAVAGIPSTELLAVSVRRRSPPRASVEIWLPRLGLLVERLSLEPATDKRRDEALVSLTTGSKSLPSTLATSPYGMFLAGGTSHGLFWIWKMDQP